MRPANHAHRGSLWAPRAGKVEAVPSKSELRYALALDAAVALLGAIGAAIAFSASDPPWATLQYYTLDSNLLLLAACAVQAFFEAGILLEKRFFVPSWARLFKYVAVSLTTVTFFVVLLVLMPMRGGLSALSASFFERSVLYHHLLCPVLGAVSFVFLDRPAFPDRRVTLLALAPTLLYAVIAIALNLARVLHGPYPFLSVYEQSAWMSVFWCAAICGFAWVLAWAVWKLALRRSEPRAPEPDAPAESEAWTADGYIKNQDALSAYTYRAIPASNNGCGPVAVFDLRRYAGQEPAFPEVLAELDGMHLFRIPGPTYMYVMRHYCAKYLPGAHEARGREAAVAAAEGSRMGVFRYLEEAVPHFVAYCRADGGWRFFNVSNGSEDVVLSIADFAAGHLRGGSVRLLYWV